MRAGENGTPSGYTEHTGIEERDSEVPRHWPSGSPGGFFMVSRFMNNGGCLCGAMR